MSRKTAFVFTIGATLLWGLLGVLGLVPAMFSVMMFDAPGSESNPAVWATALSVMSFPFVCAGAIALVWSLFRAEKFSAMAWSAMVPLVNFAVGGAAIAWIEWMQAGKFNG